MDQQTFSDGIGQVTIVGGAVRLDFVVYSPTEKDANGQPAAVFCRRIVMSLDGFIQSAAKIQEAAQAVSKLVQRAREGQAPDAAVTSAAVVPSTAASVQVTQKKPFP